MPHIPSPDSRLNTPAAAEATLTLGAAILRPQLLQRADLRRGTRVRRKKRPHMTFMYSNVVSPEGMEAASAAESEALLENANLPLAPRNQAAAAAARAALVDEMVSDRAADDASIAAVAAANAAAVTSSAVGHAASE